MGCALLHVVFIINAFHMVTGNPISSYRFDVNPVEKCPMNAWEFETAAKRKKCTGSYRYLCAPDRNLSNLTEFCTDTKRSLFEKGNCVRLEGTGDLNHYRCVERFVSGCPTEPYTDDEIYKYPACLELNIDFKCFVADKDCRERLSTTTENYFNDSKNKDAIEKSKPEKYGGHIKLQIVIFLVYGFLYFAIITGSVCHYKNEYEKEPQPENEKEKYEYFYEKTSVFSQWYPCTFVIGDKTFNCAEQYMMYQKAEIMGDREKAEIIIALDEPYEINTHGKQVKNFKQDAWENCRQTIVESGNMAKFSQNEELKQKLLLTYPKTLVEARKDSETWGIGLDKEDPRAWNKQTWRGENLLGKILTKVRDRLRNDIENVSPNENQSD